MLGIYIENNKIFLRNIKGDLNCRRNNYVQRKHSKLLKCQLSMQSDLKFQQTFLEIDNLILKLI